MSVSTVEFLPGPEEVAVDDGLTMRMVQASDGPRAYQYVVANRAHFGAQLDYVATYTEGQATENYQKARELIDTGELFDYWMLATPAEQTVGDVSLRMFEDGGAELGYRVAERAQGQGYATRGSRQLLDMAKARGVRLVEMHIKPENEQSLKVARRLGAEYMHTLREDRAGSTNRYEVWGVRLNG